MLLRMKNCTITMLFPGTSSSKCPRHLNSSSYSFGAILISPQQWHLAERPNIYFHHRWTCLTPGYRLYKLYTPTIYCCQAPVQESDPWCCLTVLSNSKETCSIAQSTPCYSYPNHKKTIWCGHAPMDINNWKVSWSYRVYFRETRVVQWFSAYAYCYCLFSALWLLLSILLKFY